MESSGIFIRVLVGFALCMLIFEQIAEAAQLNEECQNNSDCAGDGVVCTFVGCGVKKCACAGGLVINHAGDQCLNIKWLGQACNASDQCLFHDVECVAGTCACVNGFSPSTAAKACVPSSAFAGRTFARLGDDCSGDNVICFPSYDLTCVAGRCECQSGLREATIEERLLSPYEELYCVANGTTLATYDEALCGKTGKLGSLCDNDTECIGDGVNCMYVGCGVQRCACVAGKVINYAGDECLNIKWLSEACNTTTDQCIFHEVECIDGTCACVDGFTYSASAKSCVQSTQDSDLAISETFVLLGDACATDDVCFPEYELDCIGGRCTCKVGLRESTLEERLLEPYFDMYCIRNESALDKYEAEYCDKKENLMIDDVCTAQSNCPANTTCTLVDCSTSRCKCADGYVKSSDNSTCLKVVNGDEMCEDGKTKCLGPAVSCNGTTNRCECNAGTTQVNASMVVYCFVQLNLPYLRLVGLGEACDSTAQSPPTRFCHRDSSGITMSCGKSGSCVCINGYRESTLAEKYASPDDILYCVNSTATDSTSDCTTTTGETPTATTDTTGTTSEAPSTTPAMVNITDQCWTNDNCPGNASCVDSGCGYNICQCDMGYTESSDLSRCLRWIQLGHSCDQGSWTKCFGADTACDVNDTCSCDTGTKPDPYDMYCVLDARGYIFAAINQSCELPAGSPDTLFCAQTTAMSCDQTSKLCVCKDGFRETTNEEKIGHPEEKTYYCVDSSAAAENSTTCNDTRPTTQTNTATAEQTTETTEMATTPAPVRVGDDCDAARVCPNDATCAQTDCGTMVCRCNIGFIESTDKWKCLMLKHVDTPCDGGLTNTCLGQDRDIFCNSTTNKCECTADAMKDKLSQYCIRQPQSNLFTTVGLSDTCGSNAFCAYAYGQWEVTCSGICSCSSGYRVAQPQDRYADPEKTIYCVNSTYSVGHRPNLSCAAKLVEDSVDVNLKQMEDRFERENAMRQAEENEDRSRTILLACLLAVGAFAIFAILVVCINRGIRRRRAKNVDDLSSTSSRISLYEGHKNWGMPRYQNPLQS